ncbi:Serine/threonine-protein kinase mTOR [Holothuria leucospilota]|uniref:Serine/threonine-protein kinase mTOR n=1 Tax=Holothuria leucospilota TaxID=206669 RepID=A0A9Q0YGI2_HOLLE|nr:Serine/threonine-protein kinase mTOR [Holothuria leucospilota]
MSQFIDGLRSRHEESRTKAAKALQHYVTTELREVSADERASFMDDLNHHIFELVSSADVNEKKGGILAIVSLIGAEGDIATRITRFANYLRNLLPSSDVIVMEMAAKAMGRLALAGGTFTPEYVEFEVRRALEYLGGDRHEGRRHAAVLVLRELAEHAPTFFFQQVQPFFDNIFNAVRDPKQAIREAAVAALRACLELTAQRETKEMQRPHWYEQSYEEAMKGFEEPVGKGLNRDDKLHGSLLILNELIRISCVEGEKLRLEKEEISQRQIQHEHSFRDLSSSQSKGKSQLSSSSSQSTYAQKITFSLLASAVEIKPRYSESRYCRELMTSKFHDVCVHVLRYRSSRNALIQQSLLNLLPRLAAFHPKEFVKDYLEDTVAYLLNSLKKERERSSGFHAVGLLAVAVNKDISPYVNNILVIIRQSLPSKEITSKKPKIVDPAVFTCISMLARAVGETLTKDVKDLLEPMLTTGLSPALTAALHDLAQQLQRLKKDIQDGLLKMLSLVLMHKPLRHPGTPRNILAPMTPTSGSQPSNTENGDTKNIVLALRTLGSFDFEGHSLTQFVRHCADNFLSSEHTEIRKEAAWTCSRLLQPSINLRNSSSHTSGATNTQVVADVLSKLLVVAITDSDPEIRYCVLQSLDERFDGHLAQAENLSALFVALNDEQFEIRELAMCIIGRLSNLNPAYVMPSLRKTLIQIMTELEHSGVGRNKEQSAKMLCNLVSNAPRLIRPYMDPILKALIPKLKEEDPNPGVVINVLKAIGEQSQVSGVEMRKWMDELLPVLIDMLQDSSSLSKRENALWTLCELVESTGCVVKPYNKYPNLLDLLLNFLKTEQSQVLRRETIRALGLLGALDPYKHKINQGNMDSMIDSGATVGTSETKTSQEASEMLVTLGSPNLEDFYPAVAIATLMRIMKDPSLANHHTGVVQAITFIFKSLEVKCVQFLPQIMPTYIYVIQTCDPGIREFLFQQLGTIISIVKQHIRNYLDDIFDLIRDFWTVNSPLQNTIILLVEQTVVALGGEFKLYLPRIIPMMLKVFMHDHSPNKTVTTKLLNGVQRFGPNLDDYMHLLLPPIVKLFDSSDVPLPVRKTALETIDKLSDTLDFTDFASRIIHPLVRTLDSTPELRGPAMDTLSSVVLQLGRKFMIFIPMVHKVLTKHRIHHQKYETLILKIAKGTTIVEDELLQLRARQRRSTTRKDETASTDQTQHKKLPVSISNLSRAWSVHRLFSRDDWMEWLRRLSIELLKESPSHALRSCWALAQSYNPLARDLFNAAFVSCWSELTEQDQDSLILSLQKALTSLDIPEIVQILLNLAEFMEHSDKGPLPLNTVLLGERASNCRAYAKALHYKEEEFHRGPNTEILEALISINNKLHQPEAAYGVLQYAMKNYRAELQIQETWYEKLHDWDNALTAYEKKIDASPDDIELTMGRLRCLEALGEWGQLHEVACERWPLVDDEGRQQMARMAAAAAWGLANWERMEEYVCLIPRDTFDGAFYRAVLNVHQDHFLQAKQCVDKAREILDTELTAMAGESYDRAYGAMVSVQMLSEIEEIISYKLVPERREIIKEMWWERLQGCKQSVEDWQKIIHVRSLVIKPQEDLRTWLKFASLCRKSGKMVLSHKTLVMLLQSDPSLDEDAPISVTANVKHPKIIFAYIKHLWKDGSKEVAFKQLHDFVKTTLSQFPIMSLPMRADHAERDELNKLLARCYLKLGHWQQSMEVASEESINSILNYYSKATEFDQDWYKAWHSWAFMNYEAVLHFKQQYLSSPPQSKSKSQSPSSKALRSASPSTPESGAEGGGDSTEGVQASLTVDTDDGERAPKTSFSQSDYVLRYTAPAVHGFFRSIALSGENNSLQDTLRLLTLWFDYGQNQQVYEALVEGLKTIQIDTWLQVIPQLIARIDTPRHLVAKLIQQLLMDIGKQHPQALIYPLTVSSKSHSAARHSAANKVLKNMCEHSNTLVQQALMVSEELIRVAILWHELWHEGLEDASRLYFGERNVKGMLEVLEPLHAMMERGPQTMKETSFHQAYGRDLMEAHDWCDQYKRTRNVKDLTQAWDLYYHAFRRITKQLPQLTQLELQLVSPKLLMCRDLELAVPGTYDPNRPIVRIQKVQSTLQVITSKQRPRKLSIFGSDNQEYMYLLKGHEDLRQDERVMQLFGLVNMLLANSPDTFRRHLSIQRYAIIPLSTNSGLIGWVRYCDTLHTLIRDYRDKKKILLNIEHRIMLRMAQDYDHLTLMQKVEVFEHALEHTQGDDLAKLLWLKSPSSEVWFERRTNYTRSLAVMSMVGYILGLGDRHPSNLMLDRLSGKIIHIDFGDCFEVAMTREKFPEKIPFRLTRMLINAMEVTGIDGNYRLTCESVMQVIREHKDSIMAVLEAFVYDPLLNWRLMDATAKDKRSKARSGTFSGSGGVDLLDKVGMDMSPRQKKPANQSDSVSSLGGDAVPTEALNKKAIAIINRVRDKLTGKDFSSKEAVDVPTQVELLIQQATSHENLCQCYIGWCPFW